MRDQDLCCRPDDRAAREENERLRLEAQKPAALRPQKTKNVVSQKRALLERLRKQHPENERLVISLWIPAHSDSEEGFMCGCEECNMSTA